MGGLGTSTQKSQELSQTSYPQWTQDAQQDTYQTGTGFLENFLRYPEYGVAGFTTDQLKAFDLIRDSARNVFTAPASVAPGNPNLKAHLASGTSMSPASMDASRVSGAGIQAMMNPFTDEVVNATRDTINRDYRDKDAQIAAKYASGASFGGSGEALARGQLARGANETLANTTAALRSQAYDKATATALANAQLGQQAATTNSGYEQQAGLTNATLAQQIALANAASQNSMLTTGADYGLKAAQVNDQFKTSDLARQMAIVEALLKGGTQQQELAQEAIDMPKSALAFLLSLTPQQMNSQTYTQGKTTKTASPAETIGSLVKSISGIKGFFGGTGGS